MNYFRKNIHQRNGFTLVEVMVAISILATSLVAAMFLVQQGLRSTFSARNQITAFYLAQDAIEQIKSVRDSNKLEDLTSNLPGSSFWLSGLDHSSKGCISSDGSKHCRISTFDNTGDYDFDTPTCPASCAEPMKYVPELGIYGHFGGSVQGHPTVTSVFGRDITITTPVAGASGADLDEARVTVVVSWGIGASAKSVTLTEYLKNY